MKKKLKGKKKWLITNGGFVLEEVMASCNGKCNPIRTFSLKEIKRATDKYDYRHLLVWDGDYKLYKGFLQDRQVSVKRYDDSLPGVVESIIKDIVIGSNMSVHNNVLKLLGCCLEAENPMIVYEFVGDRLLSKCLNTDVPHEGLKWEQRLKIGADIANAVAYLHTAFPRPIVHRDIKASSILLDEHGVAKLIDFSLSVSIPHGKSPLQASIHEEYMNEAGYLTEKADVYLFGLLLFHLLTGYNVNQVTRLGDDKYAIFPGRTNYKEETKKFIEIVDPRILTGGTVEEDELLALSTLALSCIHKTREDRPTMISVAKQLKQMYMSVPAPTPTP